MLVLGKPDYLQKAGMEDGLRSTLRLPFIMSEFLVH